MKTSNSAIRWELMNGSTSAIRALQNRRAPAITYYRRVVFTMAMERLREISDMIGSAETEHTGKARYDREGNFLGRGKGVLPSIKAMFPEVKHWRSGPAELKRTIDQAKSEDFLQLLTSAIREVELERGEQLELFVRQAPADQLEDFLPVMYPPHKGNRRCRHCRKTHSSELHRFHARGAFERTHPTPEQKRERKADRAANKNKGVPAWVTEDEF